MLVYGIILIRGKCMKKYKITPFVKWVGGKRQLAKQKRDTI